MAILIEIGREIIKAILHSLFPSLLISLFYHIFPYFCFVLLCVICESNVKSPISVTGDPNTWEIPCSDPSDCPPSWRCRQLCIPPLGFSGAPSDSSLLYSPEPARYPRFPSDCLAAGRLNGQWAEVIFLTTLPSYLASPTFLDPIGSLVSTLLVMCV